MGHISKTTLYTLVESSGNCDGWSSKWEKNCIKHCVDNEEPSGCSSNHAKCEHARVNYDNGWCHLGGVSCGENTEYAENVRLFGPFTHLITKNSEN